MSPESLAPPHPLPPAAAPAMWPLQWPQREGLLERQHDRLEALLDDLVDRHCLADKERSALELLADRRDCLLLVRGLRLHLRLEERWLAQRGCLCPGHRAAHCEAVAAAAAGWEVAETLRAARLPWLMELQQWFHGHRHGPDALAYARAAALTPSL
ncbi:hypothetical protein KBY57_13170 [Cyanobium sp. Aljojuca 7D2]|uniref:hypothetical protein n=1 Tax=Cyanobium sp. Aljojuca 7D2 TaxID=2823698 RepID=UPI0020CD9FA7|nr:hypothetical protein [Cyanobium sp. Aljojuca 7D2]MCP9891996.1 hypothetical protein [Cyanobium sp. Aljojuca 7D2]